jgi:hypothetical protein
MKIAKKILISFFLLFLNQSFATDSLRLDIKINKVSDSKIQCNFIYHFDLNKKDTDIYLVSLPFNQNPYLKTSYISENAELLVTYGFNSKGKGIININSFKQKVKFTIEFTNVEINLKSSTSDDNGLVANLDFSDTSSFINAKNIKILTFNNIYIKNTVLINSSPKFKLVDDSSYQLYSAQKLDNVFFIVPEPKDSYLSTFFILMTISIIIGLISSVKLLNGKTQYILGLVGGAILFITLLVVVFTKMIPEDFTKDIDMISLIGGAIGLSLGFILNSAYNLIVIRTIDRQQS